MNKKQIFGLVIILIGLFFLCSSLYKMYKVWDMTNSIEEIVGPLPDNKYGEMVDVIVEKRVGYNKKREIVFLIGGIAVTVFGGCVLAFCRKKS